MPDRVRSIVADVLQIPPDTVTDETSFNGVREWDSVNHINLVLALEDAFGITIGDDDIVELTSVGAIRSHLAGHGIVDGAGAATDNR